MHSEKNIYPPFDPESMENNGLGWNGQFIYESDKSYIYIYINNQHTQGICMDRHCTYTHKVQFVHYTGAEQTEGSPTNRGKCRKSPSDFVKKGKCK